MTREEEEWVSWEKREKRAKSNPHSLVVAFAAFVAMMWRSKPKNRMHDACAVDPEDRTAVAPDSDLLSSDRTDRDADVAVDDLDDGEKSVMRGSLADYVEEEMS